MDTGTQRNLLAALHEEAYAHARYTLMAAEAREEGDAESADLLEGIARIGLHEHFAELARLARLIGADADNLVEAIQEESREREETYRRYAEQARTAGEPAVADCFDAVRADKLDDVRALERTLEHLEVPA